MYRRGFGPDVSPTPGAGIRRLGCRLNGGWKEKGLINCTVGANAPT